MQSLGSTTFRQYVRNLNRVRMNDLIEQMQTRANDEAPIDQLLRRAAVMRNRPLLAHVARLKGY